MPVLRLLLCFVGETVFDVNKEAQIMAEIGIGIIGCTF